MIRFWRDFGATSTAIVIVGAFLIVIIGFILVSSLPLGRIDYSANAGEAILATTSTSVASTTGQVSSEASTTPVFIVTHVSTPTAVKAIYMSSWAAGHPKFRKHLFDLIDTTEINSVVIDVKDYSGRISFMVEDPVLKETGAAEKRIPDVKEFIGTLHDKGVYVIARISSFQDSYMINIHPDWAVKTLEGNIWQDYKGVKWLDAGAEPVWKYIAAIGHESYNVGFDELNFDYIRFPSDGNLKNISYSWGAGRSRSEVMKDFFAYIHGEFAPIGIPISADLFGLTTSSNDDLGIGQILEDALEYFDYVAPMVYPSHFGAGYNGYKKPALFPYEVVRDSMNSAIIKAEATTTKSSMLGEEMIASTTPQLYTKKSHDINKLRPWLQAFDLGGVYTSAMVRTQIDATYDVGLNSWMLWNAGSVYDKGALLGNNIF